VTDTSPTRRAVWMGLGALTAAQVGIGLWRVAVMLEEALAVGPQPIGWSWALGSELLTSGLLAACAWWWLPRRGRGSGERSAGAWAIRFLLMAWIVVLFHYGWALASGTGALDHRVTWVALGICFALGAWVRRGGTVAPSAAVPAAASTLAHPGIWLALWFYAAQAVHLVFPYQWTDSRTMWACRAFKFVTRGGLGGVSDCLDPGRPPLHSILLWLGIDDPTFQGRLLPFLMMGAFGLVVYHVLRRVAPRLAPWGVLWFFATDTLFRDAVTSYAGAPEMIAIGVAIILATDDGTLGNRWFSFAGCLVAGLAIALIKRDGLPEFVVALGALAAVGRREDRRDPRLWAPLVGIAAGYLSWTGWIRSMHVATRFVPTLAAAGVSEPPLRVVGRLLFGVQGQVFSHYGWGAFAWAWIAVAGWAAVRGGKPEGAAQELARRYGWFGLAGWLATLGIYAALSFLGHPEMSSLFGIRTGFGRHLLHFFPFCLFHATAAADRCVQWSEASD